MDKSKSFFRSMIISKKCMESVRFQILVWCYFCRKKRKGNPRKKKIMWSRFEISTICLWIKDTTTSFQIRILWHRRVCVDNLLSGALWCRQLNGFFQNLRHRDSDTLLRHRDVDNLLSGASLHPFHVDLFKSLRDRDIDDLIVVALQTLRVLRHGVCHRLLHDMFVTAFLRHILWCGRQYHFNNLSLHLSKNLQHKHSDDEIDVFHSLRTT